MLFNPKFSADEASACRRLVGLALQEDLGAAGDLTSQAVISAELRGRAVFVARTDGVVAGLPAAEMVCEAVDPKLRFEALADDGTRVKRGDQLATGSGPMRSILAAERTALNFLQRLSGVATLTRRYVDAVAGLSAQILDTRKTTPGWRLLEKYAVRCGGGHNHRMGLYDGVLIKDNHLAARSDQEATSSLWSSVGGAIVAVRQKYGDSIPVEIEVDSLDQLYAALVCKPDMVLLDNMPHEQMREAVCRRNIQAPRVLLEASGGATLDTVRAIAETGVDRISVGALTHSAPALDIALDYLP